MIRFAIFALVLGSMALATVGCRAEGEIDTATVVTAPR